MAEAVRITIRVHPGASRDRVAGESAGTDGGGPVIGVWVHQRAVDGRATEAALAALAGVLGLRRRDVRLVTGERSRTKVVEVGTPPSDLAGRLAEVMRSQYRRGRPE